MNAAVPTRRSAIRRGLDAARANVVPGLVLQAIAVAILLAYYFLPASREMFVAIADAKDRYGFAFSIVSTGLCGGLFPLVVARLSPSVRGTDPVAWRHLPYLLAFWSFKGFEIDLLYRGQAALFGEDPTLANVTIKTVLDQFVYCLFYAVPTTVLVYQFKEYGYSWSALRAHVRTIDPPNFRGWAREHVLPVLLSNWGVWVPTVIVIYCLPEPLQLPIQNVILCLWAVLMLWLTKQEPPTTQTPDEVAEDETRRAVM